MMDAHYRLTFQFGDVWKYLRVTSTGREWVDSIDDATTWPTAAEAGAVARTIQVVAR